MELLWYYRIKISSYLRSIFLPGTLPRHWYCVDCGKCTSGTGKDYYMIKDELWKKYGVGYRMLCMDCIENRLGRKLQKDDLTDCPLNTEDNEYTKAIINGD